MAKWPIGPTRDTAMLRLKLNDLWRSGQIGGGGDFDGPAADITQTDINNWNAAFSWGNHADAGYLTSETDPTVPAHVKAITATQIGNWDTAFSWGNHAGAGYIVGPFSDAIHGDRGGGTLHAVATDSVAGFMAAADKAKLDGLDPDASGFEFHRSDDQTLYWFESAVNLLQLISIDPSTGSVDGDTNITATGTGFSAFDSGAGDSWTIGGNPVTDITVVSDTEMTGKTPASDGGATGSVDVTITVGSESDTLVNAFTYKELWTPADITTALWLDAADESTLILDGSGNVEQWNDKSGNGRNFSQGSSSLRPASGVDTINGLNLLTFDGDRLQESAAAAYWKFMQDGTGCSVFSVAHFGATSDPDAAYALIGNNANTNNARGCTVGYENRNVVTGSDDASMIMVSNGSGGANRPCWHFDTSTNILPGFNNLIPVNKPNVLAYLIDPAQTPVSERGKTAVNGGDLSGDNESSHSPSTSNPTHAMQVGAGGNNVLPLIGKVLEILVISGVVPTETRNKAEGYLAHRAGLTEDLDPDHPHKVNPPLKD